MFYLYLSQLCFILNQFLSWFIEIHKSHHFQQKAFIKNIFQIYLAKIMLQKINDYTTIKILSQSQCHTLFLVQSPNQQKYILKLIQVNKDNINDATSKAQSYLALKHPNIVNARQFFFYNQEKYLAFVLEYCPAGDISCLIGKIQEDDAKHLIMQIAQGLAYLHDRKIIHKDIRPENILINNGPKISELGISKLMGTSNESTIVGTPFYLAPEGFKEEEKIDQRFDIWSLGIISLELLLGKRIYDIAPGQRAPALRQDFPCTKILSPIKDKEFKTLVEKMLKKRPEYRPTARQVAAALLGDFQQLKMEPQQKVEKPEEKISLELQIKQQNNSYKFSQNKKSGMIELQNEDKRAKNFMEAAARSFVEVEGTVFKKGSSIRFQMEPSLYVAVGLGVRNYDLQVKGFKNPHQMYGLTGMLKMAYQLQKKFQYGLFLVFHNGQIVYPFQKKHKEQYTDFKSKSKDVMRIETNQKELIFVKEKGESDWDQERQYRMPINLTDDEWKEACFIACLYGLNDAVTILPPLEPKKTYIYGCEIF